MKTRRLNTLVIGSGASGLAAALRLKSLGVDDILLLSEGLKRGTSINTGSDKQTYYKLGVYGAEPDSPALLGRTLFDGGSVHGDVALVEAAMSVRCFMNLVNLGVPFPCDEFGQYIGYKTDHDPKRRATSCGPYTSREMCLALIRAVKAAGVEIAEQRNAAELVSVDGRAAGAVVWNRETKEFEAYLAENTVFAVGGPGGLYASSVYPAGHMGGIGLALKIGAAEFIAAKYRRPTLDFEKAEAAAALLAEDLLRRLAGTRDWRKDRRELQERMTGYAGHLRRMDKLDDAADAARNLLDAMYQEGYPFEDADHAVTNFHLAFASWVYLEAISFQAATGTGSRGSAAVLRPDGSIVPENPAFRGKVLETAATPQGVRVRWEPCRPFPETDGWFETVWAAYRNGTVYG